MAIPAQLLMDGPGSARSFDRRRIRMAANWIGADGAQDVMIEDLSRGGCAFSGDIDLARGDRVRLRVPAIGDIAAWITWRTGTRTGCAFERALSAEQLRSALATSPVVWGDFPANPDAATQGSWALPLARPWGSVPAPASYRQVEPDERWPLKPVALAVGAALTAFWVAVALIA